MRDGERVEVAEWAVKEITSAPVMIVPAAPGTFILGGVDTDDASAAEVWQTPVIAFAIGSDNEVTPWTVDGPNDGITNPGPLLMPNGMVIEVASCCHRSIDEWFAEQQAKLQSRDDAASAAATPGAAD